MFFSSIKEINRLINKGMSNIYLKVTIEKKWRIQNYFLTLDQVQFWSRAVFRELQLTQISMNFKTSCYKLKIKGLGAKL